MAQVVLDMVEDMWKLPLKDLIPLQGNLKNLEKTEYDKLKKSMLEMGFSAPFFAWKDEKGRAQLLDGHQRLKVLGVLSGEGVQLPDTFPVVFIRAKDKEQAAKKLLVITSSYAKTTQEGLSDFAIEFNIDMDFINQFTRIADVSFSVPDDAIAPELSSEDRQPFQQVAFYLHDSQVEIVQKALKLCIDQYGEEFDEDVTENKNSNAIAKICELFLEATGEG